MMSQFLQFCSDCPVVISACCSDSRVMCERCAAAALDAVNAEPDDDEFLEDDEDGFADGDGSPLVPPLLSGDGESHGQSSFAGGWDKEPSLTLNAEDTGPLIPPSLDELIRNEDRSKTQRTRARPAGHPQNEMLVPPTFDWTRD